MTAFRHLLKIAVVEMIPSSDLKQINGEKKGNSH